MISNDLKTTSNDKKTRSKIVLKGGSVQEEIIEINEHYLDKILKNKNSWTFIFINGISHAIIFYWSNG